MSRDQCEAYTILGPRCHYAAKHTHQAQTGDTFKLCNIHLRTLLRREDHGSDEEKVQDWLSRRAAL